MSSRCKPLLLEALKPLNVTLTAETELLMLVLTPSPMSMTEG
jgi:hypothetical protein